MATQAADPTDDERTQRVGGLETRRVAGYPWVRRRTIRPPPRPQHPQTFGTPASPPKYKGQVPPNVREKSAADAERAAQALEQKPLKRSKKNFMARRALDIKGAELHDNIVRFAIEVNGAPPWRQSPTRPSAGSRSGRGAPRRGKCRCRAKRPENHFDRPPDPAIIGRAARMISWGPVCRSTGPASRGPPGAGRTAPRRARRRLARRKPLRIQEIGPLPAGAPFSWHGACST